MIHLDYLSQAIIWAVGGIAGGLIIRAVTRPAPKRSKERQ